MSAVPPLIPGSGVYSTLEINTAKINTLIGDVLYKLNSWKGTVDVATVGSNIALVGLYAIDGYTVLKGDRVLVMDQTDPINNGIYVADLLAWNRSADLPLTSRASGVAVFVTNGTLNFDRVFVCTNADTADIVGVNSLVFDELVASASSVGTINQIQVSAGADLPVVASTVTATVAGALSAPTNVTAGTGFVATTGGYAISTKVSGAIPGTVSGFSGVLTTASLTTTTGLTAAITVTNTNVTATSTILLQLVSYSGTIITNGIPVLYAVAGAGSFSLNIANAGANPFLGIFVINYLVL